MWWSNAPETPLPLKKLLLQTLAFYFDEQASTVYVYVAQPQLWVRGVPEALCQDDHLVLNISARAVHHLEWGETHLQFHTRFSGQSHQVFVDLIAIEALVAVENGQGIRFELDEALIKKGPQKGDTPRRAKFTVLS